MTEFVPDMPVFPDPREVLRGAVERIKDLLSPTESPDISAPESDVVLQGLYAAKREDVPAEDPEEVKRRDKVQGDQNRHYKGGETHDQDGNRSGKGGVRPNNRDSGDGKK